MNKETAQQTERESGTYSQAPLDFTFSSDAQLAEQSEELSQAMLRTLLLGLGLASGSALLMPAAPLARAAASVTRVPSPAMELHRKGHVVRIEVELEQGEPCVPLPPRLGT